MKVYNLVVSGNDWSSSTLYGKCEDAIAEAKKMEAGQKVLEGENNVDTWEIRDYEALTLPMYMNYGIRKYASETRTLFNGKIVSTWRVVYEQEVK